MCLTILVDVLRIVHKFVENIQLVVIDACEVDSMNSSGEKLPPCQIEDLWHVRFDSFVDRHSKNDSHTFQSLLNKAGKVFFTQDLVEATRYVANTVNDELICKQTISEKQRTQNINIIIIYQVVK